MAVVTLAFCTGPAASITVNETLTVSPSWLGAVDDFDMGAPTFEGSAESVGGEYGYRTVSFTLKLIGTYAAVAPKMQTIVRQLLKARNWLAVTWGTSTGTPWFLRTYRTAPQSVAWSQSVSGVWTLPVTLVCDPFLYGPEVTIGPQTITNATPFYTFPTILGDAPAPLSVAMTPTGDWTGFQPMITVAAYESGAPTSVYMKEAEAFTMVYDASIVVDAAMSGGNRVTVTFDTQPTMAYTRLNGNVTPPEVGLYKVIVRCQKAPGTDTHTMRFVQSVSGGGGSYYGNTISFSRVEASSAITATWIDLGDFAFPFGIAPSPLGEPTGAANATFCQFQVQQTSGTGSLYIDRFDFIPIDTPSMVQPARTMKVAFPNVGPDSTQNVELDAEGHLYNVRSTSTGKLMPASPPIFSGGYPQVVPGATNTLQVYAQTLSEEIPNTIGGGSFITSGSADYTFSYYPRYLYMRV